MDYLLNTKEVGLSLSIGAVGGLLAKWFGGWSSDLNTLLIFMVVDFAMGLLLAMVWGNSTKSGTGSLQSNACFKGLIKKGVALLFVLVGQRLDLIFNTDYVRTGIIIAFITNELISIVENSGMMGVPLPKTIINCIEVLKNKQDNEGVTNEDSN